MVVMQVDGSSEEAQLLTKESSSTDREVSVENLSKARDVFFAWTFWAYVAWGIMMELYSNLFYYSIDNKDYAKASFYSTLAMTLYSASSFFFSPIAATMSDTIGRKPIFVLAALVDGISGVIMGLVPSNWVFILMLVLQGAGDNSQATGYSLLTDYVVATPKGHSGSDSDSWFFRQFYSIIRMGTSESDKSDSDGYMERELNLQYTVVLIIQTVGLLFGVLLGDLLYMWIGSYGITIAFSGFICLPMVVYIMVYMPETVPPSRRKPFTWTRMWEAFSTQWHSFAMFMSNHRLFGLSVVNFIVQFISAGVFDVVLYWGEWKFGWNTDYEAIAMYVAIFSGIAGAVILPRLLIDRGYKFSHMIGFMCLTSAVGCIPCGFSTNNIQVMFSLFVLGVGFGCLPAVSAQIANEATAEDQGRINGFNYAVSTLAWAISPYAYWYIYASHVDDDADDGSYTTHRHNTASSLIWWVTSALFFVAGFVMLVYVGDSDSTKLKHVG